jgi:hypothetical protein
MREREEMAQPTPLLAEGDHMGVEPGWPGATFEGFPLKVEFRCLPFCIVRSEQHGTRSREILSRPFLPPTLGELPLSSAATHIYVDAAFGAKAAGGKLKTAEIPESAASDDLIEWGIELNCLMPPVGKEIYHGQPRNDQNGCPADDRLRT